MAGEYLEAGRLMDDLMKAWRQAKNLEELRQVATDRAKDMKRLDAMCHTNYVAAKNFYLRRKWVLGKGRHEQRGG